ncbi:malate synthase G [Paraglaciecola sp. 2405UD69-4]|uniref:malate synthase G n=1 Tax=Paraglaciecola sp. 2405UD69-4 TaxID=3391836 RepID=UPI0039C928F7
MNIPQQKTSLINEGFYNFINEEVLPLHNLTPAIFWENLGQLVTDLAPVNRQLLATRKSLQHKIDQWHLSRNGVEIDTHEYESFLREIGYIVEEGEDFSVTTNNVDAEIASMAGPQLVVPAKNARFLLNAANARWGSLYDAFYGTDLTSHDNSLTSGATQNDARRQQVISMARDFLDSSFPLASGSHHDVISYVVYYQHLLAFFADGSETGLLQPCQFVALTGPKSDPESVLLKNHGLHVEIVFNRNGTNGAGDSANIEDILVESAISTIVDCEDSVAAVDAQDKLEVYRNWLGLMQGTLKTKFEKGGETIVRCMNKDHVYTSLEGEEYRVHGRSLLMIRNVGHLMESDLMEDHLGNFVPEGILDAVVTALIGAIDLKREKGIRNSRCGSIYIVKPKMHGPEEVAFSCELFRRVELMLGLAENTIKIGIMDEERRTSFNLKECIRAAKERVVFINTGFLDRTGDEIHTSMQAGAFLPKEDIKTQAWIEAYEKRNVQIGLQCGLSGKAQIGKGMWAMPDEMQKMMHTKIAHPKSGANTAWVPSPTAATLHALHYHQVDVFEEQRQILKQQVMGLEDLLLIPLMGPDFSLTEEQVLAELQNNIQSILGYVVRWIDDGVGCSKVPDINNVSLMEDRATLRISSQHIANWLTHGICSEAQVERVMRQMAKVVDEQNVHLPGYRAMTPNIDKNQAFKAAHDLIFKGAQQPNGYTEPLLHRHRVTAKQQVR